MASYCISLLIAKKGQSHTIGEEYIIPSVREVIETVMKEDSSSVLRCFSLSINNVQHHIVEMDAKIMQICNSARQMDF